MGVVVPIKYAFVGPRHLVNRRTKNNRPKIQIRHNWIDAWLAVRAHFARAISEVIEKEKEKQNEVKNEENKIKMVHQFLCRVLANNCHNLNMTLVWHIECQKRNDSLVS